MKAKQLSVFKINTESEVHTFKNFINTINPDNPFYKPELFKEAGHMDGEIHYFIYFEEEVPLVLMCFYLRPIYINGNLSEYTDVSSPYGYSGPLFKKDLGLNTIENFWELVDNWYKSNGVVTEFIRFSLDGNHLGYTGATISTLDNVMGRILTEEEQWQSFKPKVRNNYRKAQKEELKFEMFYGNIPDEIMDDFYNIYISTMKRNKATDYYFFPKCYFSQYLENNPENATIAMVFKNNIPISTEFILLSKDTIFSYLGGTNSEYFHTRPNDFLKIEVMDWGRKNGKKFYVLGGGRQNGDPLYKYKKNFFPKENDIIYYTGRKVLLPEVYREIVESISKNSENLEKIEEGYFPIYRS
ncbi:GNAT family N-acetyltransferase [Flagellimonas okinawensis]|uniref:GNAT family N-acetyltransferase n=1 Tax=Flagellimonas okinawensis TaxID=3031324 RepID=A0ABT5XR85_9FLAO|nr:GNAT family N-acetyltransferase [[Muricauda] okinawensis]MDF0708327.1 GNAT family N-acetyltransferase [[Muricauda] okinawensis]